MPIQSLETSRLYQRIADQLAELIAAGEFPEGTRLPSERELAAQLGVSRPSVREALIALEVSGKVKVRVGAGVFVAARQPVAVADAMSAGLGPFELLRARWLVEGEICAEAAVNAKPEDLDVVRGAVDRMHRSRGRRSETDDADRDFHVGIAKATHNSALVMVSSNLWDQGRGAIWKRMEHHFQTPELRAATLKDHRSIVAALEARDSLSARTAMRRHLERVDGEFSRGWELLKEEDTAEGPARKSRPPRKTRTGGE